MMRDRTFLEDLIVYIARILYIAFLLVLIFPMFTLTIDPQNAIGKVIPYYQYTYISHEYLYRRTPFCYPLAVVKKVSDECVVIEYYHLLGVSCFSYEIAPDVPGYEYERISEEEYENPSGIFTYHTP